MFWLITAGLLLFAAQSLFGQTIETTETVERSETLISLLFKGGFVMIPLVLCSFMAVGLTIERFISLSGKTIAPEELDDELDKVLTSSSSNKVAAGVEVCEQSNAVVSKIYRAAIDNWEADIEDADEAMSNAGRIQIKKLRRSIRWLRLIAGISPLLGLLGTVVGMIQSFQTVALSSMSIGKAELLAEGIYQAMVTTAAGLCITIPTLVAFSFFSNQIDRRAELIEIKGNDFLTKYFRNRFKLES